MDRVKAYFTSPTFLAAVGGFGALVFDVVSSAEEAAVAIAATAAMWASERFVIGREAVSDLQQAVADAVAARAGEISDLIGGDKNGYL